LQIRAQHLDTVRQHESALELTRRDPAVEVLPGLLVALTTADRELVFLDGDVELVAGEARNRQRDAQPLWPAVFSGDPLDIIGRITVGGLGDPVERPLDLVEAEKEGAR